MNYFRVKIISLPECIFGRIAAEKKIVRLDAAKLFSRYIQHIEASGGNGRKQVEIPNEGRSMFIGNRLLSLCIFKNLFFHGFHICSEF
jgi:hypothetical protein